MDMVMDFLLLAASVTAGLYCFILNRRLKGLTAAKTGLGAGIASLSQSAEEMKFAVAATKKAADEAAIRLEKAIADADKKATYLDDLISQLGEMSASVTAHAEGATQKYIDTLAPIINEANASADRLADAIAATPENPFAAAPARKRKPTIERAAPADVATEARMTRKRARAGAAA